MGYNVKIVPLPFIDKTDPLFSRVNVKVKDPLKIYHAIPTTVEEIFYTVTEVRKPPDFMTYPLQQAKMILTQSNFCKKSFSGVTEKKKIHVVNFPFPAEQFSPIGPSAKLYKKDKHKFTFLTIARVDIRKNLKVLMNAFNEEFGENKDVCLIMKMGSDRYCIPKIFYDLKLPKNIFWMRDFIKDTAMLYRAVDSYIATDNGEGWGAPTTEAMLCGLPTAAPRHSGHLDYMNNFNSFLIDVGDWEYIGQRDDNLYPDLLGAHLQWKRPKIESIKKQLRKIYETFKDIPKRDRIEMDIIKNAINIKKIVSHEFVGKQLETAFSWYEGEYK